MKAIETEIRQLLLEPKRKFLINKLLSIITEAETSYIPKLTKPEYYEIWFNHSFDFNYVIIGKQNFSINIATDNDNKLFLSILKDYNITSESEDEKIHRIKKTTEFIFFSDCWSEIEKQLDRKIRCFLIEYGIIRGWDVNKLEFIDGEDIEDILNDEGIPNHY